MARELNPNHPVTTELRSEWHKLCALVMQKLGLQRVVIDAADIEGLLEIRGGLNVVAHVHADCIETSSAARFALRLCPRRLHRDPTRQ